MKLSIPSSVAKELTPGMNISVNIITAEAEEAKTAVPSRAIFSEEGKTFVWVYNEPDSTIHKKHVAVEGTPIGKMTVVGGLNSDDRVVEVGVKQLYEGEKVNVLNRNDIGL